MHGRLTVFKALALLTFVLVALCFYKSARNFIAANHLRTFQASVIASKLVVDWIPSTPDSRAQPGFTLVLDLIANDESKRTVHWEGDAGRAAYPEEALDEFENWKPGSVHTVGQVRGDARELRFNTLETSPETTYGIVWLIFGGLLFFVALAFHMVSRAERLDNSAVWIVFMAFGLPPLLGGPAYLIHALRGINNSKVVDVKELPRRKPFNVAGFAIPNVEVTQKAKDEIAKEDYHHYEYTLDGRTYHLGNGTWYGVFDSVLAGADFSEGVKRLFVDPNDRWEISNADGWKTAVFVPSGILLFFGVAFCGSGLLFRKLHGGS